MVGTASYYALWGINFSYVGLRFLGSQIFFPLKNEVIV